MTDEMHADAKAHDNEFSFNMVEMSNLKFDVLGYCITKGQEATWGGITRNSCTQEKCTLTVSAGRKGSKDVATWFKAAIAGGSAIGCGSFDRLPQELNFAFRGDMSFSHKGRLYVGKDLVLAQGHDARSRNNWWIGGPNMSQLVSWPTPHLGIVSQTFFHDGVVPSIVFFLTLLEQISSVDMGLVDPL